MVPVGKKRVGRNRTRDGVLKGRVRRALWELNCGTGANPVNEHQANCYLARQKEDIGSTGEQSARLTSGN